MNDSNDPLKAAFEARKAAETKSRAGAAQLNDAINEMLQKWGDDLAAALDAATATMPSMAGTSTREVHISGNSAVLEYVRHGADFELTVEARAICGPMSTPGVPGPLVIVGDPRDDDALHVAILEATIQPNDGAPVTRPVRYTLRTLDGYVSVDPTNFALTFASLA